MKRPLALLIAIVAVALVGSGCSGGGGVSSTLNDAATMRFAVKGSHRTLHVSRARLLSEVRSIVNNKPFATYLKQQNFTVSHDLSAASKLTAIWLTQLIQQAAIDELFEVRHLRVTAAIRTQAANDAAQFFPGETIFPAFSEKFRATLTDRRAKTEALLRSYTKTSDAAGKAYFRAHQVEFGCPSGKNVAHILVATESAAEAILDQVNAGASFATLAKQESTDTQSATQGGLLGCLTADKFVAEFQTAADAAPVGEPVGPVKTQFGYHLILVTKAAATKYESVRTQVLQALQQEGSQRLSAAVNGLFKRFKVHLDPRFGKWELVQSAEGQSAYQVTPPKAPAPANSRGGTTTTGITVPVAPNGSP